MKKLILTALAFTTSLVPVQASTLVTSYNSMDVFPKLPEPYEENDQGTVLNDKLSIFLQEFMDQQYAIMLQAKFDREHDDFLLARALQEMEDEKFALALAAQVEIPTNPKNSIALIVDHDETNEADAAVVETTIAPTPAVNIPSSLKATVETIPTPKVRIAEIVEAPILEHAVVREVVTAPVDHAKEETDLLAQIRDFKKMGLKPIEEEEVAKEDTSLTAQIRGFKKANLRKADTSTSKEEKTSGVTELFKGVIKQTSLKEEEVTTTVTDFTCALRSADLDDVTAEQITRYSEAAQENAEIFEAYKTAYFDDGEWDFGFAEARDLEQEIYIRQLATPADSEAPKAASAKAAPSVKRSTSTENKVFETPNFNIGGLLTARRSAMRYDDE